MSAVRLYSGELPQRLAQLRAGDRVLLSGVVYTARDAAHKRMFQLLDEGKPLPFPLEGAVIYYAGPTPGQQGMAVGACGPTTAGRMDRFAPRLLDLVGGAGALIARCIQAAEVIAFDDLGCESIKRMTVRDLPLTVAVDSRGSDLFRRGRAEYQRA